MKSNREYLIKKYNIARTINQFILIKSFEELTRTESDKKWLDLASGIHGLELTKEIINELRLDSGYSDINIKRMEKELGIRR